MCNHHFSQFQKGIAYCTYCNTYLLKQRKQTQKTKKVESTYRCSKKIEDNSLIPCSNRNLLHYLTLRKLCIGNIRHIVISFNYPISVIYKALVYLDNICLNIQINYKNILNISTICVLFALQFNECCTKISLFEILSLVKTIPNFHELEIFCLQTLNYNLSFLSVYDYINNLFYYSKLLNTKSILKRKVIYNDYLNCLHLMNLFIEDDRALDFPPFVIAMSIIKFILEKKSYFNIDIIHNIYNVNWKIQMYLNCNYILNTLFNKVYIRNN